MEPLLTQKMDHFFGSSPLAREDALTALGLPFQSSAAMATNVEKGLHPTVIVSYQQQRQIQIPPRQKIVLPFEFTRLSHNHWTPEEDHGGLLL